MKRIFPFIVTLALLNVSCMKDWLDVKSDKKLVVPAKLDELRALLNNTAVMNVNLVPALLELSADDYFLQDATFNALALFWERNAYLWNTEIFIDDEGVTNWAVPYGVIYHSNLVLDGLQRIEADASNRPEYEALKGTACFFRAYAYYQLVQAFCEPYDANQARSQKGLPLRKDAEIDVEIDRANLFETYEFIFSDLRIARELLPNRIAQNDFRTLPSKSTAHALMAKTYLAMGNYGNAWSHASESLSIHGFLLDYNHLVNIDANYPITRKNNEEVLIHNTILYAAALAPSRMKVADELYEQYDDDDLRKRAFYRETDGLVVFKGSYHQNSTHFGGITTAEMYLIKAECEARMEQSDAASQTLDTLLKNRYSGGAVPSMAAGDSLLERILRERRKELVFRGIRWTDIRRLNKYDNANVILSRTIDDTQFVLNPNDSRYVFPIPPKVINLSKIEQNLRN